MDFILKRRQVFYYLFCLGVLFFLTSVFIDRTSDRSEIIYFDIGQGNSTLITLPRGVDVIIDGGPDQTLIRKLGKYLPFWKDYISLLFVTNADTDHYKGFFDLCGRYKVGMIIIPPSRSNTITFNKLLSCFRKEGTGIVFGYSGKEISFGDIKFRILFPDRDMTGFKTNDSSQIIDLFVRKKEFLFTGDAPKKIERYLSRILDKPKADYILIGHHGSKTSSDKKWISLFITPVFSSPTAIISAGKDNKYGHPHKDTIDILNSYGFKILRTMGGEDIRISP